MNTKIYKLYTNVLTNACVCVEWQVACFYVFVVMLDVFKVLG